ncbi:MAG TPA: hypothetical protein VFF27_00300 [Bacteroidia bacterium]|jgi:hypothetical protein|nr:hypothetical protein [Bacteroidia bacterium]
MKHLFYLILLVCLTAAIGCIKEKQFPPEPVIEFQDFVNYIGPRGTVDSADCIIKFTDGDGDVGLAEGDTISPPNLRMKYLYKNLVDGKFYPMDAIDSTTVLDTLFFDYRIPTLTPDGQYKALDGTIKAKFRAPPVFYPGHKVVKFEIVLKDRAGHKSNIVTTNEITVP